MYKRQIVYNNVLAIWEQVGYNRRDNYKMRELVSKGEIMKKRRSVLAPVSYTHLDVYKRQDTGNQV